MWYYLIIGDTRFLREGCGGLNNKCMFCDCDITYIGEYAVCKNCETVCFTKSFSSKQVYQLITDYLCERQKKVLLKEKEIYELDSKLLNGCDLSDKEKSICNCLKRFQESRTLLEVAATNSFRLDDKQIRHALYDLICISEELDAVIAK